MKNHDCQPERPRRWIHLADISEEPFRLFFPLALLAGVLGVAMWPLHFVGWLPMYPGVGHARILVEGFFAGFMIGFLGTALPRLLETRPFRIGTLLLLALLQSALVMAHFLGKTALGDILFAGSLVVLASMTGSRFLHRRDMPPPSFVLIPVAWLCGMAVPLLSQLAAHAEDPTGWITLERLLLSQGFLLLPILGVGIHLLPRFLDGPAPSPLAESRQPQREWGRQAATAGTAGLLILLTLPVEVLGWHRTAHAIRFLVVGLLLIRAARGGKVAVRSSHWKMVVRSALFLIPFGLLLIMILPHYRTSLLHVTLAGGMTLLTLGIATRVVFGHSGKGGVLNGRNWWLLIAAGFLVLGMLTRVSGDFLPQIMVSHYNYGAACWILGSGLWAWRVFPGLLVPDPESVQPGKVSSERKQQEPGSH